jgi:hypothetical protein
MIAQASNWVGEITTTQGTGVITLGGQIDGYASFSSMDDGPIWYAIIDGSNREAGVGTLSSGGASIIRSSVAATLVSGLYSDNDPSAINLSGAARVYCTFNKRAFDDFAQKIDPEGGTMVGPLTLFGNATEPLQAVPKQQLDQSIQDVLSGLDSWVRQTVIDPVVSQGIGYLTSGGQSTNLPENPIEGKTIAFADLNGDWFDNPFSIQGNGNVFAQDNTELYEVDMDGAYIEFAFLAGAWEVTNFGRLSSYFDANVLTKQETEDLINAKPNPNLIINGGFDFWQRGTTSAANGYLSDRWYSFGAFQAAVTSQEPGSADADTENKYFLKMTAQANTEDFLLYQVIEDVQTLAGQKLTIQFKHRTDVAGSIKVRVNQDFGTNGSPTVFITDQDFTVGASGVAETITLTVDIPSVAGKTIGNGNDNYLALLFNFSPDTATGTGVWDVFSVKAEQGSEATPFIRAGNTKAGELAMCQRYYENSYYNGNSGTSSGTAAFVTGATVANNKRLSGTVSFNTSKRTSPSMVVFNYATGNTSEAFGLTSGGATAAVMVAGVTSARPQNFTPFAISTGVQAGYRVHWEADAEL